MRKLLLISVAVLLWCASALAACTGSSPTWTTTPDQTSFHTCLLGITAGDTINISSGSATWSGAETLTKLVFINGAGGTNTQLTSATFIYQASARVTGIDFIWNSNNYTFQVQGVVIWRFDHNVVTYNAGSDMALVFGQTGTPAEGLIDHNTITYGRIVTIGDCTPYNGTTCTAGLNRWAEPLGWGSTHYVYVEANTISFPDGSTGGFLNNIDGNYGARYVYRFNNVLNGRVEMHSLQGDYQRAMRSWEVYDNNETSNGTPGFRPFLVRGGTGLLFDNTSDGGQLNNVINADNDRSYEGSIGCQVTNFNMCGQTQPSWPTNCSGTTGWISNSAGTSPIDGNTSGQFGWACRDQIGESTDVSLWPDNGSHTGYSLVSVPAQTKQPAFFFHNTQPGGEIPVTIDCDSSGPDCSIQTSFHIIQNRDYYLINASPGSNQTTGVARGTFASIPTSCTNGVAYWATDRGSWNTLLAANTSGQLYVCNPTGSTPNTYALYYTPCTYPMPVGSNGLPTGSCSAGSAPSGNRLFGVFGNPSNCGGITPQPFTAPQWQPNTLYYGVAVTQMGNAWVQNGGRFYRNESGGPGTSAASVGPTCTTGTCADGTVTAWRAEANNNKQCGDDWAHDVLPHLDGVTIQECWGGDLCSTGFETSNGGGTASAGYNYTNFDALINDPITGYINSPYWPSGKKVAIMLAPVQGAPATGGNTYTPAYVTSPAYALTLSGPPAANHVAVCSAYKGDLNSAMGGSTPSGIFNVSSSGVTALNIQHGWTGMQELPARTAWNAALTNAVTHYNSQPFVDYLRIAPGQGGESFMSCYSNWSSNLGFTQAQMRTLWETTYMQTVFNTVAAASPNMPTVVVTNCQSCIPGTGYDYTFSLLTAQYSQAVSPKFWLEGNGLANTDVSLFTLHGNAAGSGISSDHANLWNLYPTTGKVFQTLATTDPTGNGTGSLVVLLPFQSALCALASNCVYEAFWQDMCIAWCVNYSQYATYHVAYQTAISNFRAQVIPPSPGTGLVFGLGKMVGKGSERTH